MNGKKAVLLLAVLISLVIIFERPADRENKNTACAVVPGEFSMSDNMEVWVGIRNITSDDIRGASWTTKVERGGYAYVNLDINKEGAADRFNIELFVDDNDNGSTDAGEHIIYSGVLSGIKDSYKIKIKDGANVRLNYQYLPELKTELTDKKVNKAMFAINIREVDEAKDIAKQPSFFPGL